MSFIGLFLIAVGTGGIKPCVASFGGEQFKLPEQQVSWLKSAWRADLGRVRGSNPAKGEMIYKIVEFKFLSDKRLSQRPKRAYKRVWSMARDHEHNRTVYK